MTKIIFPIHKYIYNSKIYLIDKQQKNLIIFKIIPNLIEKLVLCQFDLQDTNKLKQHLVNTNTTVVIDVSFGDTVNMLSCCNKLGIKYINTALENELVDEDKDGIYEGVGLCERYKIFKSNENKFKNTTAIVCSGMNPGVIQWMALEAIKNNNNKVPKACYIVELILSYKDESLADKNTLYTTWSTECFLDEAILSYPLFVQQHTPLLMYNKIYELEFKVRLGDIYFLWMPNAS